MESDRVNGGVDADIRGATSLPGLYAAGECANFGFNGPNRLSLNSLPECPVFGGAGLAPLSLPPGTARAGGRAADRMGPRASRAAANG